MSLEQTFIMIKPDGVARGLVGEVIKRFEQKVGSPGAFVQDSLSLLPDCLMGVVKRLPLATNLHKCTQTLRPLNIAGQIAIWRSEKVSSH